MAGRGHQPSPTPLPMKLGIREGSRVVIVGAPHGFALEKLPPGTRVSTAARGRIDVALLFVTRRAELERRFARLAARLEPAGRLWVAWPKKRAGAETDLSFDDVQRHGLETGLVDNKSASIDEVFQGLQFVIRLRDRG